MTGQFQDSPVILGEDSSQRPNPFKTEATEEIKSGNIGMTEQLPETLVEFMESKHLHIPDSVEE